MDKSKQREVVTSRCYGSKLSTNRGKYGTEKTKKLTCMTFQCFIALRNKTVAHTFMIPSFDN